MRRLAIALFLVASVSASAVAASPFVAPQKEDAKEHLERGRALFQTQQWDAAIVEFEKGELQEPLPIWLYNLGQAHRFAGHHQKAKWYFDRYIAQEQNNPDAAEYVKTARDLSAAMVAADGEPRAVAPDPAAAVRTTAAPQEGHFYHNRLGLLITGVGVLGLGGGVFAQVRASSYADQANVNTSQVDRQRLYDEAASYRTARDYLFIGGGVVLAAGIAYLVLAPDSAPSTNVTADGPTASLDIGPGWFGVKGSF